MARKSLKLNCVNMLLSMITYSVLEELAIALPSSGHSESRQSRSSEKPSTDQQVPHRLICIIAKFTIILHY